MTLSALLQTPDTSAYMVAGYVVFLLLPALFILSLIVRRRNLRKDEEVINSLMEEDQRPEAPG